MFSAIRWIVNLALPATGTSFSTARGRAVTLGSLSRILNAYAIVLAALLVVAGRLGDRPGRRPVFLAGVALFTLTSLPEHRAATGSALVNSVRQMSVTVGVARLVAVVGAETGPARRQDFRLAWLVATALALVTAGLGPHLARATARAGEEAGKGAGAGRDTGGAALAASDAGGPLAATASGPAGTRRPGSDARPGTRPAVRSPSGRVPEPRAGGRPAPTPAADRSSAQHYHRADRDGGRATGC
ncbi:hypothetical protein [Kitasatospora sp. SolWspMP-SS2h]|uniref:hypothetical protein n=1 Tax=Kitasatospora sp. SolWspMP-SS2h TaxID=1305729 RepID=UPI0018F70803|nr:hypothetical protein [Kitasatospora sp. SolWspMP-SS2h]